MIKNIQAIILAAGKSTRFNTEKTKLAATICGRPMILFPTKLLQTLNIPTTVVVGYQQDIIKNIITAQHGDTINFVVQEEQLGTGHALATTKDIWQHDNILVLNGDAPRITQEMITKLSEQHIKNKYAISFITSCDPSITSDSPYGRIVKRGTIIEIVEAKDLKGDLKRFCCINAGIYIINKDFLLKHITSLNTNNASKEFYITDLVKIASKNKLKVSITQEEFNRVIGVNTMSELHIIERMIHADVITQWINYGIRFGTNPSININLDVTIGHGSYIGSGVQLLNRTVIGKNCTIMPYCVLDNVILEDNVTIYSHSVLKDSIIQSNAQVGPFAHVHSNTSLGHHNIVGNFVEIKNSTVGTETKTKHLTYIGDATIGSRVNIGAGTITCNYDGTTKHRTVINNDAFIGSNNTLVAPLTIGENAFTAAGSTITTDVPRNAFAIARSHQTNKSDYVKKLRNKLATQKRNTSSDNFSFVGARVIHSDNQVDDL